MFKSGRPDGSNEAPSSRRVFKHLVLRARAAQDEKRYADAAALYGEALRLSPGRANLHIQRGHMLKEAGQLSLAEHHYLEALRMTPEDADLHLLRPDHHQGLGLEAKTSGPHNATPQYKGPSSALTHAQEQALQ